MRTETMILFVRSKKTLKEAWAPRVWGDRACSHPSAALLRGSTRLMLRRRFGGRSPQQRPYPAGECQDQKRIREERQRRRRWQYLFAPKYSCRRDREENCADRSRQTSPGGEFPRGTREQKAGRPESRSRAKRRHTGFKRHWGSGKNDRLSDGEHKESRRDAIVMLSREPQRQNGGRDYDANTVDAPEGSAKVLRRHHGPRDSEYAAESEANRRYDVHRAPDIHATPPLENVRSLLKTAQAPHTSIAL
jgi:hypothetical protein